MGFETQHFFDPRTSTLTYVVYDPTSKIGVVIDPVLDFDPKSARTSEVTMEPVCRFIEERGLAITYALAGELPAPEGNGTSYLKIPLNRF